MFTFTMSPWEILARGTAIYWFLFLLFRFVLKRDAGSVGLADILVVVMISDAAQNGMSGDYKSVPEGCLLITTIVFWNLFIDWCSFRFPWFQRFAEGEPLVLVRNGRIDVGNLRRQLITRQELQSKLREEGLEHVSQVKLAMLEPDGSISVVPFDSK